MFGLVFLASLLATLTATSILAALMMFAPRLMARLYQPTMDATWGVPPDATAPDVHEEMLREIGIRTANLVDSLGDDAGADRLERLRAALTPEQAAHFKGIVALVSAYYDGGTSTTAAPSSGSVQ